MTRIDDAGHCEIHDTDVREALADALSEAGIDVDVDWA
jgi:hypothetical protein